MAEEYVVSVASDEEPRGASALGVIGVIWYELSGGIGPWGALRPLVALALSLVPFLYLGQHFNRQHRKAFGWFVIQLPLIFSVVLWPVLFIWSIADAWWASSGIVAKAESE
jgi:cell division protein FtsX